MPEQTTIQDPIDDMHKVLFEKGIYKGDIKSFREKYSNTESIDQLFNDVKVGKLFSGDKYDFYADYFPSKKEHASYEKLHKVFKKAGYEGSENDFRQQYKSDESLSTLFTLAKGNEMFSGNEEEFIQEYFPSKAKPSKAQNAAFDNRFDPFTQKKNLGGTTSSPTKLPSQESVKPKEYTKPSEKTNIFGGTFKEPSATPPEGTADLGVSRIESSKLEMNRKRTPQEIEVDKAEEEYKKKRSSVYKEQGKVAGIVFDVESQASAAGSGFANRAITIPADFLDWVGATARKIDKSLADSGVFGQQEVKDQSEYSTTQASTRIRKFANDLFPQNPAMQDRFVTQLATGVADLAAVIITRNPIAAVGEAATVQSGGEFRQAYDFYTEVATKDPEEIIAQRARSEEEADVLRKHIAEIKASGVKPEDNAWDVVIPSMLIGSTDAIPVMKYLRKLDRFSGGAVGEVLKRGEQSLLAKTLGELSESRGGRVAMQSVIEASQEVFQQALQNLTAKETYDRTRNIFEGAESSATVGGALGAMAEMMLGVHVKRRAVTTDPKEAAILDASIEYLQKKKEGYDAEPGSAKPESEKKEKLSEALDSDISPEASQVVANKLAEVDDPKEDKGDLAPIIEKQYKEKIDALESDMAEVPDEAKAEIKKRIDDLKAEKKEVLDQVYPDGVKVEEPKKKTLKEKLAEQKAKEAETLQDKLKKAREKEAENNTPSGIKEAKVEPIIPDKVQDEKVEIAKEEQVQQKPEISEKLSGIIKSAKNKSGNIFYALNSTTKWYSEINKFFRDNYGIDDVLYNFQNKRSKKVDANGYYTLPDGTRVKETGDRKTGDRTIYIQSEKFNQKEQVQQKPEVPEVKGVDKVEDALELEKEAKLKEVGKPEVKMEFMSKPDLKKAKDIDYAVKEHRRILDEHKVIRSLIECLWA